VTRPAVAGLAATAAYLALAYVLWFEHTPGMVSYGEFRFLLLAAVPALTVILSASWVDAGRRDW